VLGVVGSIAGAGLGPLGEFDRGEPGPLPRLGEQRLGCDRRRLALDPQRQGPDPQSACGADVHREDLGRPGKPAAGGLHRRGEGPARLGEDR